jgi:nitrogen fixation/metabolism regulation signal transduction histidine kinase
VSQQARLVVYLVVMHLLLAAAGVWLVASDRLFLFVVEIVFAISLVTGVVLVRRASRHLEIAGAGIRLIAEHEFTSRFLHVGDASVDALIDIYNTLVDRLREERTRLQEQHHFLSHILRVSPSAIVICDFDHRVTELNPAAERIVERPAAAVIGQPLAALATPLSRTLLSIPPGDSRVVGAGGGRRVKCQHGTFLDRGFPRHFFVLEELTEELRQAERDAYEKLIRVMAHEVNNSVAASNSLLHSSLAYAGELTDASRTDFEQALRIVIARTSELNRFMRRFADVFRLPAPAPQNEDLVGLLRATMRLVSARPEAAGITWEWDVAESGSTAWCDRGQIEQALINIVQNAVDAAGPRGTVVIRLRTPGHSPIVTIDDNGPGITPEARDNLFTPFFSTKPHGQGIGLTLVQEILSAHGFDYALERIEEGWTRFTIQFEGTR